MPSLLHALRGQCHDCLSDGLFDLFGLAVAVGLGHCHIGNPLLDFLFDKPPE